MRHEAAVTVVTCRRTLLTREGTSSFAGMIEHVSLRCRDPKASRMFYEKALAPLGYRVVMDYPDATGFMAEGHTSFWVTGGEVATPTHIAFRAKNRRSVDAFHRAAIEAGAQDHGAPGLRDYSPTYYAAFVLDRDGHNIEAVTFARAAPSRAAKRGASGRATPAKAKPRARKKASRRRSGR